MLEAQAHSNLKTLLRQDESNWPHHLTLSRLVGRSLRRGDRPCCASPSPGERWWLGLLMPLCLQPSSAVLVLTEQTAPATAAGGTSPPAEPGFPTGLLGGCQPPPSGSDLAAGPCRTDPAHRHQQLGSGQLLMPGIDQLSEQLRRSMAIRIDATHWEQLAPGPPPGRSTPAGVYMNGSAASCSARRHGPMPAFAWMAAPVQACAICSGFMGPLPSPWSELLAIDTDQWASWAELDHQPCCSGAGAWNPWNPCSNSMDCCASAPR